MSRFNTLCFFRGDGSRDVSPVYLGTHGCFGLFGGTKNHDEAIRHRCTGHAADRLCWAHYQHYVSHPELYFPRS